MKMSVPKLHPFWALSMYFLRLFFTFLTKIQEKKILSSVSW